MGKEGPLGALLEGRRGKLLILFGFILFSKRLHSFIFAILQAAGTSV